MVFASAYQSRWKFSADPAAPTTQNNAKPKAPEVGDIQQRGVFHRVACPKKEPTDQKMPQLPSASSIEILKLLQPRISSSPQRTSSPDTTVRVREELIKGLAKSLKAHLQPIVSLPKPVSQVRGVCFQYTSRREAAMIGGVPFSYSLCDWNVGLDKLR